MRRSLLMNPTDGRDAPHVDLSAPTGAAIWGRPDTDDQHTFFRWLHQGTGGAAVDFIIYRVAVYQWMEEHNVQLANYLAHCRIPLQGASFDADLAAMLAQACQQPRRNGQRIITSTRTAGIRRYNVSLPISFCIRF